MHLQCLELTQAYPAYYTHVPGLSTIVYSSPQRFVMHLLVP